MADRYELSVLLNSRADTSGVREFETAVGGAGASLDRLGEKSVRVPVDLDTRPFDEAKTRVETGVADLDGTHASPDVGLETRGFDAGKERVDAGLKEIDGRTASASADLDTSRLVRGADLVEARMAHINGQKATATVDADTQGAETRIGALEGFIRGVADRISGMRPVLRTDADTSPAEQRVGAFESFVRGVADRIGALRPTVRSEMDTSNIVRGADLIEARMARVSSTINAQKTTATVDADIARGEAKIGFFQGLLNRIDGQKATASVDADTAGATTKLAAFRVFVGSIVSYHPTVNIDVDVGAATAKLVAFRGVVAATSSSMLGVVGGAVAAGAAITVLAGAFQALVGTGAILGGLLTGAAAGFGLVGAAAFRLWQGLQAGDPAVAGLQARLDALKGSFSQAFGPAAMVLARFGEQVLDVANGAMPRLGQAATSMSTTFTDALRRVGQEIQTALGPGAFDQFLQSSQRIMGDLITTVGRFGGGLLNMFMQAQPGAEALSTKLADIGKRFLDWTASEEGRKQIAAWMKEAATLGSAASDAVGKIGSALKNVDPRAIEGVAAAIRGIGTAASWAIQIAGRLATELGKPGALFPDHNGFQQIVGAFRSAWSSISSAATQAYNAVRSGASSVVSAVVGFFQSIPGRIGSFLRGIGQTAQSAWNALRSGASSAVQGVVGFFQSLPARIGSFLSGIGRTAQSAWNTLRSGASSVVSSVIGFFQSLPGRIGSLLSSLGSLATSALRGIASAAGTVVGEIVKFFMDLPGRISSIWETIKSAASAAWEWIKSTAQSAWDGIVSFVQSIPGRISSVWETIKSAAQAAWEWVKSTASSMVEAVVSFILSLPGRAASAWETIKSAASAAWEWIKSTASNMVEAVISFVLSLPGRAASAWESIKSAAQSAWEWIKTTAQSAFDAVVSFVQSMPGRISSAWDSIKNYALDTWEGIKSGVISAANALASGVVDAFNWLKGALADIGSYLYDNIVAPFKDAYNAVVGNSIVPDMVRGVDDWVRRVPKNTDEALRDLPERMGRHFRGAAEEARKHLADLPDAAKKAAGGLAAGAVVGGAAIAGGAQPAQAQQSSAQQPQQITAQQADPTRALADGATRIVRGLGEDFDRHGADASTRLVKHLSDTRDKGLKELDRLQHEGGSAFDRLREGGLKGTETLSAGSVASATRMQADSLKQFQLLREGGLKESDVLQKGSNASITAMQQENTRQALLQQQNATQQSSLMRDNAVKATEDMRAQNVAKTTDLQQQGTQQQTTLQQNTTAQQNLMRDNAVKATEDMRAQSIQKTTDMQQQGTQQMTTLQQNGTAQTSTLQKNVTASMTSARDNTISTLTSAQQTGSSQLEQLRQHGTASMQAADPEWRTPVGNAAQGVQNYLNDMLYGMGQVIDQAHLSLEKPSQFSVRLTGGGGGGGGSRFAGGGIVGSRFAGGGVIDVGEGSGVSRQQANSLLAQGWRGMAGDNRDALYAPGTPGVSPGANPTRPGYGTVPGSGGGSVSASVPMSFSMAYASGGAGAPVDIEELAWFLSTQGGRWDGGEAGISGPRSARVHLWGEGDADEGYLPSNLPIDRALPILHAMADWYGQRVVPESQKSGDMPREQFRVARGFAVGGLSPDAIAQLRGRAEEAMGAPYAYGSTGTYAGPDGYSCSGLWNWITSGSHAETGEGTYAYAAGKPGWLPGPGQVEIGVDLGGWGGADGTHMAGDIEGATYESDIPSGVHHGYGAGAFGTIWHIGDMVAAATVGGGGAMNIQPFIDKYFPKEADFGPSTPEAAATEIGKISRAEIIKALQAAAGSGSWNGGGSLDEWISQGILFGQVFQDTPDIHEMIRSRAMQESSGDPNAVNNWDSNAAAGTPSKGLMQIIQPTWEQWRAMFGEDAGPFEQNWSNPVKSVGVATRYMEGAYGGPVGANGSGYTNGGIATKPQVASVAEHGPEFFMPLHDPTSARQFVDFLDRAHEERIGKSPLRQDRDGRRDPSEREHRDGVARHGTAVLGDVADRQARQDLLAKSRDTAESSKQTAKHTEVLVRGSEADKNQLVKLSAITNSANRQIPIQQNIQVAGRQTADGITQQVPLQQQQTTSAQQIAAGTQQMVSGTPMDQSQLAAQQQTAQNTGAIAGALTGAAPGGATAAGPASLAQAGGVTAGPGSPGGATATYSSQNSTPQHVVQIQDVGKTTNSTNPGGGHQHVVSGSASNNIVVNGVAQGATGGAGAAPAPTADLASAPVDPAAISAGGRAARGAPNAVPAGTSSSQGLGATPDTAAVPAQSGATATGTEADFAAQQRAEERAQRRAEREAMEATIRQHQQEQHRFREQVDERRRRSEDRLREELLSALREQTDTLVHAHAQPQRFDPGDIDRIGRATEQRALGAIGSPEGQRIIDRQGRREHNKARKLAGG